MLNKRSKSTSFKRLKKELRREADSIAAQLASFPEVQRVILHGSLARDDVHPFSDIDLIVIGNFKQRFFERWRKLLRSVHCSFDLEILPYTPEEFEELKFNSGIVRRAIREGKILYEAQKD